MVTAEGRHQQGKPKKTKGRAEKTTGMTPKKPPKGNAPRLHEADDIIKEALDDHFKGKKWHFFQTSPAGQMGKFNAVSEVIQRLKALPSKFPWMVGKAQVS